MEKSSKILAAVAQLSFLYGWIIVPLAIWLIADDHFVRRHSKQALLNQFLQMAGVAVCVIITLVSLGGVCFWQGHDFAEIGWSLSVALLWTGFGIFWIVLAAFCIAGAIRAMQGKNFYYPFIERNYEHTTLHSKIAR